jgi:transcriptional regulator with XRE-family HTH domain
MSITTAQIRGARGVLNWSQADLAERTGISATSIGSIENGQTSPRASTLHSIQKAFETGGIEFIGRDGVRLKTGEVRVFTGRTGYLEFYEHVYETLSKSPGQVLVSNVDERDFAKWHGELGMDHLEKMSSLSGITYRILIREGDNYFPASSYAEYRWIPKEQFASVPFYVFGKKLAIMLFDNEPTIILLDYPAVAQAYRIQFEAMWSQAMVPQVAGKERKLAYLRKVG